MFIIAIVTILLLIWKYCVSGSETMGGHMGGFRGYGGHMGGFRGYGRNALLGSGVVGYNYYFDGGSFVPCDLCPNEMVCPYCPQYYSEGGYIY